MENSSIKDSQLSVIRSKRDSLMAKTDWTQFGDSPLSVEKQDEYKVYRQKLRDIPQNYILNSVVVWPVLPQI
jgi:hypothetical protein